MTDRSSPDAEQARKGPKLGGFGLGTDDAVLLAPSPSSPVGATGFDAPAWCRVATENNWDSDGALPTTKAAIETAKLLTGVPGVNGGLQIELHTKDGDVEVEIGPDGAIACVLQEVCPQAAYERGQAGAALPEKMPGWFPSLWGKANDCGGAFGAWAELRAKLLEKTG